MDRIHRLGQRRPVQAIKIVIEDSIESRIVQLQEKKSAMVDATLSTDDSVRVPWIPWTRLLTATSLQAMGRLTPEDVRPYLPTALATTDLRVFLVVIFIQSILIPLVQKFYQLMPVLSQL